MDRALDIATNRTTSASEAIRQRFRYRCLNDDCRAFVLPCLGQYRRYFRHEEGSPWCPEMVDARGQGTSPDDRVGRVRRLVLGNGGWKVVPSQLNVVSLSCALTRGADEQHVYFTETLPLTKQLFFMDPDYGGRGLESIQDRPQHRFVIPLLRKVDLGEPCAIHHGFDVGRQRDIPKLIGQVGPARAGQMVVGLPRVNWE